MDQRTTGRAIAVTLALAAAAGLDLGWRRKGSATGRGGGPQPWRCECGQRYRVSGEGRHRVYWVEDAPEGDPVLGTECVNCERPLPA
ncbi:MAG TPA: hypothetical protein VFR97_07665 [Capillimicrobium sp.]|nr:hypothetical protein [Capillimicrobium sp.]